MSLLGAAASHYDIDTTQKVVDLLSRYPHVLSRLMSGAELVAEHTPDIVRQITHPGPTGIVHEQTPDQDDE